MKLRLTFQPGFSAALAGWSATLVVGGAGSVSCHWLNGSAREERSKSRVALRLDEAQFATACDVLQRLSDPVLAVCVDDAPSRHIHCSGDGLELSRARILWSRLKGDDVVAAEAFDRIWMPFFSVVRPVLVELGMPERLMDQVS